MLCDSLSYARILSSSFTIPKLSMVCGTQWILNASLLSQASSFELSGRCVGGFVIVPAELKEQAGRAGCHPQQDAWYPAGSHWTLHSGQGDNNAMQVTAFPMEAGVWLGRPIERGGVSCGEHVSGSLRSEEYGQPSEAGRKVHAGMGRCILGHVGCLCLHL